MTITEQMLSAGAEAIADTDKPSVSYQEMAHACLVAALGVAPKEKEREPWNTVATGFGTLVRTDQPSPFFPEPTEALAVPREKTGAGELLADKLERLCCAETEGKFFDCVTDNIDTIISALRSPPATAGLGPFAWRACDERYQFIHGLVTDRESTVEAWREARRVLCASKSLLALW